MKRINCLLLILLLVGSKLIAQNQISIKAIGVGFQPFNKKNLALYKSKLSDNGTFNLEPGVILGYETYPRDNRIAWAVSQGIFADCAGKPAGYTQLALKGYIVNARRRQQIFGVAIGPAIFYRKTWTDLPEYVDEKYKQTGNIEYKPFILSIQIQYNLRITSNSDLTFSLHHIEPKTFTLAIGYSFYNRRPANPCDCPKFGH